MSFFTHTSIHAAEDSWGTWKDAKTAYDAGHLDEALQALQDSPMESSIYYYNLGTIYHRSGRSLRGLAYLEKAHHLNPKDPDIQQNLSQVREALEHSLSSDKLNPPSTLWEALCDFCGLDSVLLTLLILGSLATAACLLFYLNNRNIKKVMRQPAGFLCLFLLGFNLVLFAIRMTSPKASTAICLVAQPIHSGPGNHFQTLTQMEEGSKLRLLGKTKTSNDESTARHPEVWYQIRYSPDGVGWTKAEDLLIL